MCKVNLKLQFDFGNIGFDEKNVKKNKINKYINIQRY